MRAQGYDGTASMSGIHRGVQASIRERILIAQYVHSNACFKLSYCTFLIRCIGKEHDGDYASNRIRNSNTLLKMDKFE